ALNFDIHHVSLAVQDRDQSAESRALVASFVQSTYFDVAATVSSDADVARLMDAGTVRAVLVIPEDFSRTLGRGGTADVQVLLNGDNANTATTVLGYANGLLQQEAASLGGVAHARVIQLAPRVWYNPQLRSTLFL